MKMERPRLRLLLTFLFTLFVLAPISASLAKTHLVVSEESYPQYEGAEQFVSSQNKGLVSANMDGYLADDLDRDGDKEAIIVWTARGSNYLHKSLTILSRRNNRYVPISSLRLNSTAKLETVKKRAVYITQDVRVKGDLACCPTGKKTMIYGLHKDKIFLKK
jgi:hypothetical protein